MNRKDTNFFISASQSKKADSRQHRIAKEMCTEMHTGDFYLYAHFLDMPRVSTIELRKRIERHNFLCAYCTLFQPFTFET